MFKKNYTIEMAIETVRHFVPSLSLSFSPLRCLLCTMGGWGCWAEKEWIVGCPDPPNRWLFVEAVLQENQMNYFKTIMETSLLTPPTFPPSPFICWQSSGKDWEWPLSQPQATSISPNYPSSISLNSEKSKIHLWILNIRYEFRSRKCILCKA